MTTSIPIKGDPSKQDIAWLVKNIGDRTHWTNYSIGGKGWTFVFKFNRTTNAGAWYLSCDDEKMLTYFILMKDN